MKGRCKVQSEAEFQAYLKYKRCIEAYVVSRPVEGSPVDRRIDIAARELVKAGQKLCKVLMAEAATRKGVSCATQSQ